MSKWWWLTFIPQPWSKQERLAAGALVLALGVIWIPLFAIEAQVLKKLGLEAHLAAIVSFFAAGIPAALLARPIVNGFNPELLKRAEEIAAKRMSSGNGGA